MWGNLGVPHLLPVALLYLIQGNANGTFFAVQQANSYFGDVRCQRGSLFFIQVAGTTFVIKVWHLQDSSGLEP